MKFTTLQTRSQGASTLIQSTCRLVRRSVLGALIFSLCSTSARALDTDIYFDRVASQLPNIVFYMDTSGSMGWAMNDVPIPFNPATTYSGNFTADALYYAPGGRVPSNPSSVSSGLRGYMHCDVANTGIDTRGFFTGRLAGRLPNIAPDNPTAEDVWLPLDRGIWATTDGHMVDCFEDRGTHGENGAGTGATYLSNSTTTSWTNSTATEMDWTGAGYITAFTGNYINYKLNPPIESQSGTRTSKAVAMRRVLINVAHLFPQINAGLARMSGSTGASIILPVQDNRDVAARTVFENAVNALPASGSTPLAEGLYEVYSYYRGANRLFGNLAQTHPSVLSGDTYISPITHECQRNHVMMFTDGVPWSDFDQGPIEALPDFSTVTGVTGGCFSGNTRETNNSCLDELGEYMSKVDSRPALPNVFDDDNDGTPDGQIVKVHPVGVQIDFDLLQQTANKSGTNYFSAQNALQLENNLVDALSNIAGTRSVASRVVTSSDQFSRVSHRNEVFTGVYEPSSRFQWQGNVKKYRIAYDGIRPYLTDSDETNDPEILTSGGTILGTAQSYWSASPDGNNILEGGARERLGLKNPATRNMYGINNDSTDDLTSADHVLSLAQPAVDAALGATTRSAAERQNILDYALGYDVLDSDGDTDTTDAVGQIGGMARNEPLAIQYGGTASNPDIIVFAATSDGLLHGFDGETGEERFAVAPLQSVPDFVGHYDNTITGSVRSWGLDGKLSAYVIDKNRDGVITYSAGDRVYLYVAYGLGGRTFYVLDVTRANDTSTPRIIVKERKHNTLNTRWTEYGHALSKPIPVRLRQGTGSISMMAMSMGYDPNAEYSYTGHTMGRGLTLMRVDTGWNQWAALSNSSAGSADLRFNDMDFAFAAEPSPVDTNGDGFTDRLYAVDLGAQVWRFDISDNFVYRSSASLQGGRIAELGADTNGNRRRVFKPIRTALVRGEEDTWVALAFGTGDRMNPLVSPNDNRLYMIRDVGITNAPGTYTTLDNDDLYDATPNAIGTLTNQTLLAQEYADLNSAKGWYVDLPSDRKAISSPLIAEGIVNYPVYTIPSVSNPCERGIGEGTLYRMRLFDAQPIYDYNGNSGLDTDDREVELATPGIPADLVGHRDEEGRLSICVGLECFPSDPNRTLADENPPVLENYWYRKFD